VHFSAAILELSYRNQGRERSRHRHTLKTGEVPQECSTGKALRNVLRRAFPTFNQSTVQIVFKVWHCQTKNITIPRGIV